MSLYLKTKHRSVVSVGICDRCSFKLSVEDLMPDRNIPGLRVCKKCCDDLDPYKLPGRKTETTQVRYPRPETPLVAGTTTLPVPDGEPN